MIKYFIESILVLILVLVLYIILKPKYIQIRHNIRVKDHDKDDGKEGSCNATTCGAIDDVNNPKYNVEQCLMNTVLIEEHLAEKNKYCKECLVKHYLLCIGYLQEAITMASKNIDQFPELENSLLFFKAVFEKWSANKDVDETRLETLSELRSWRQKMIRIYYF
jgi:hypothetical protein